jgi:hypothetical protein
MTWTPTTPVLIPFFGNEKKTQTKIFTKHFFLLEICQALTRAWSRR